MATGKPHPPSLAAPFLNFCHHEITRADTSTAMTCYACLWPSIHLRSHYQQVITHRYSHFFQSSHTRPRVWFSKAFIRRAVSFMREFSLVYLFVIYSNAWRADCKVFGPYMFLQTTHTRSFFNPLSTVLSTPTGHRTHHILSPPSLPSNSSLRLARTHSHTRPSAVRRTGCQFVSDGATVESDGFATMKLCLPELVVPRGRGSEGKICDPSN